MPDELKLDSYLPLYDTIPENWELARQFLVEQLKKISEITNAREIGWFLDEELLSGKQFIPGINNNQEYRSIFRKVVDTGPLQAAVVKTTPHGIVFDNKFTLIHLYGAATNSTTLRAVPLPNDNIHIEMTQTDVTILSPNNYNRSFVVIEYIQEL